MLRKTVIDIHARIAKMPDLINERSRHFLIAAKKLAPVFVIYIFYNNHSWLNLIYRYKSHGVPLRKKMNCYYSE